MQKSAGDRVISELPGTQTITKPQLAREFRECYDRLREDLCDLRELATHLDPDTQELIRHSWLRLLELAANDEHRWPKHIETVLDTVERVEFEAQAAEVREG